MVKGAVSLQNDNISLQHDSSALRDLGRLLFVRVLGYCHVLLNTEWMARPNHVFGSFPNPSSLLSREQYTEKLTSIDKAQCQSSQVRP